MALPSPACALLVAALAAVACAQSAGHSHEVDGENGFAWAGLFEVPEDSYVLTLRKVGAPPAYAESGLKLAVLALADGTHDTFEAAAPEGGHCLEEVCTAVAAGGTLGPEEDACKIVSLDNRFVATPVALNTTGVTHIAVFAEHPFAEFNATVEDDHGDALAAVHTLPEASSSHAHEGHADKKWGETIAATAVVMCTTLVGLIFMAPHLRSLQQTYKVEFDAFVSAFAGGAILGTAVFLLMIESTHLMGSEWTDETELTWRWGAAVLGGFAAASVVDLIVFAIAGGKSDDADPTFSFEEDITFNPVYTLPDKTPTAEKPGSEHPHGSWVRVASSVMVGDFLHNFVDGMFIGTAFTHCGTAFGWTVAMTAVYHELPQEMSDFILLTERCGFSRVRALLFNFLAGSSVMVGAIAILLLDIDSHVTGLILAVGSGIYLQIGAAECLPRVYAAATTVRLKLVSLIFFVVGATCIGLVLLDHEHCSSVVETSASGESSAHAGHGP